MTLLAVLFLAASSPAASACPSAPSADLMGLPYAQFDIAEGEVAWRNLLNRGCVDAAVATLEAYRSTNRPAMSGAQLRELGFHIGQALALAGREAESAPHFETSAGPGSTAEWSAYVDATLAFVRKDRARLEVAAARYEELAGAGSMRMRVIRGFLACFDRPYKAAVHCGM